jgi:hypothetical protein
MEGNFVQKVPPPVHDRPPVVSLVPKRFEDGGWTGVARFDWELRKAIPGLISLNTSWRNRWALWTMARRRPDTVVVTGNETSLLVPDALRTIVVHHGCAQTHWDRDPQWHRRGPRAMCRAQRAMYRRPNRWYVALAAWTAEEFARHYDVPKARVIPSWVEPIPRSRRRPERPVVIGDWRTFNKGETLIPALRERVPEVELRPLDFTYDERAAFYADADAYLCLSLSEGGSYSVADAEAAALPLVTTDVGNYREYGDEVVPWQQRDDLDLVRDALLRALAADRGPSFFETWTRARWTQAWHDLIGEVADSDPCPPLKP